MSIKAHEANKLIDDIHKCKTLNQKGLPEKAASLIRRSLTSTVKISKKQENLLIFFVDFSKHTMIVSVSTKKDYKKTLFCIVRPEKDCKESDLEKITEEISNSCFQHNLYGHPLLIFLYQCSEENRITFQEQFKDSYISDAAGMKDLLLSIEPYLSAQQILKDSDQLATGCPFSYLGPCQPNMFFGRKQLIKDILFDTQNGYAITGGRRIGKTSLLFKIRHELENDRFPQLSYQVVYIDCSTFSNFQELIAEITKILLPKYYYHKGRNYSFTLIETLTRGTDFKEKTVILLLDEMDKLIIKAIKKENMRDRFFESLRAGANENNVRLVISGFRQVSELISDNYLSLFNLCEAVTLGVLNKQEVCDLLFIPFKNANIELENKYEFIETVMEMTSGHPSFVQFIAKKLFKERKGNRITIQQLKNIYSDRSLMNFVLDLFTMNTSPLERLICLSMIDWSTFSYDDVTKTISKNGFYQKNLSKLIHSAQKNLAMNSILTSDGERYQFLNEIIRTTIKKHYHPDTYIPIFIEECKNG
jgi:hypothetical protein